MLRPRDTDTYTYNTKRPASTLNNPTIDFLLLVGKDDPYDAEYLTNCFLEIKKICDDKKLSYAILGDGKTGINLDDIDTLPKANNVAILGHGITTYEGHAVFINENDISNSITHNVIQKIQMQTGSKNYIICACKAGKVTSDIKNDEMIQLQEGTSLIAFADDDEPSFISDGSSILTSFVESIQPEKKVFMFNFARDIIETISETMIFAYQVKNEIVLQKLLRRDRKLHVNITDFVEYRLNILNNFANKLLLDKPAFELIKEFKQNFPGIDFDKCKVPLSFFHSQMNQQEFEELEESSLLVHICHEDTEVLDVILANKLLDQTILFKVIQSNEFKCPEKIVSLILKHGKNVTPQLTADCFLNTDDDSVCEYNTPLTLALHKGNYKIVKALLDSGADIFLKDSRGNIPADTMKKMGSSFFIDEMNKANRVVNSIHECYKSKKFIKKLQEYDLLSDYENVIREKEKFDNTVKRVDKIDTSCLFLYNGYVPSNKEVYTTYREFIEAVSKIDIQKMKDIVTDELKLKVTSDRLFKNKKTIYKSFTDIIENCNDYNVVKSYLSNDKNKAQTLAKRNPLTTALDRATELGHLNAVRALLDEGADITTDIEQRCSFLYYVVSGGHLKLLNDLFEIYFLKLEKDEIQRMFFIAVGHGYIDIARKMQNMGADIHQIYPGEESAELVIRLNPRVYSGQTPLCVAVSNNRFDLLCDFWDEWESDINKRNNHGETALHFATFNGCDIDIIKKLKNLSDKTGHNIASNFGYYGRTPFHYAIMRGKADVVRFLLKLQPTLVDSLDQNSNSSISIAIRSFNTETINCLLEFNVNCYSISTDELELMTKKHESCFDRLMEKILNDHIVCIENINDISKLVYHLGCIIDDESHPLKFKISETDTWYTQMIEFGKRRLVKLLGNNVFTVEVSNLIPSLTKIANTNHNNSISDNTSIYQRANRKSPSEQLMEIINCKGQSNTRSTTVDRSSWRKKM